MLKQDSRVETADFVFLDSGCYFSSQFVQKLRQQPDWKVWDMYGLPDCDLTPVHCLVIDGFADQEFLYQERAIIRRFLDDGKIVIFCGHLFRDWLPGGSAFVPKQVRSYHDYTVLIHQPHPIFAGVRPEDMTYRKGVAGFFARGHHPLPPLAEVLLTLADGEPITYIDRFSTRGTILVHAGNNLFGYDEPSDTSGRIAAQLKRWVRDEYGRIRERREMSCEK